MSMNRFVVCVKDTAANLFGTPMFVRTTAEAVRGFAMEVNRPNDQSLLYLHPNDFELWHIGIYFEENGQFEMPEGGHQRLCRGMDVKTAEQK